MIDTILNWLALKSKAYKALSVRVEWLDEALDVCRADRLELAKQICKMRIEPASFKGNNMRRIQIIHPVDCGALYCGDCEHASGEDPGYHEAWCSLFEEQLGEYIPEDEDEDVQLYRRPLCLEGEVK